MNICKRLASFLLLLLFVFLSVLQADGKRIADRVVLISMDGLCSEAVSKAYSKRGYFNETRLPDTLVRLMVEGACTLKAKTILPSVTLPAHVSMLTGLSPERHGITQNWWKPGSPLVKVDTLFQRIKRAGMGTAMVVGKARLGILNLPGTIDRYKHVPFSRDAGEYITDETLKILGDSSISFLFVHYPYPDHAGHLYGWMSSRYLREVLEVDRDLKRIVSFLTHDSVNRTLLIVTSDHGGHGFRHGTELQEDLLIPWIAWGPMVRRGYKIENEVKIYDTAVVVMEALGISDSSDLDGKPLREIWKELSPFVNISTALAFTGSYRSHIVRFRWLRPAGVTGSHQGMPFPLEYGSPEGEHSCLPSSGRIKGGNKSILS